jgi:hypothetical protein
MASARAALCSEPEPTDVIPAGAYQAWPAPQCGHITVVETLAWKSRPHSQV